MRAFTQHVGRAAPLPEANVDTDQIIPSDFLKRISRTGFEDGLFAEWRKDPAFVLNRPEYQGISVLVAGENFGCGSSREHAVWAIQDYGIHVVIAPSFADIFRGNSGNSGLVLAEVSKDVVENIWGVLADDPSSEVGVDLHEQVVRYGDSEAPFSIDPHTRHKLLNGLDNIEIALSRQDEIEAFEARRPLWRPLV